FELTERLRQDDKFKDIPIILVTSLASEVDKRRGLNLGANAYIAKGSFDQEELLHTIRRLIP
ncbi:MAG: response regulator, partial [Bacteroidota bacterium]|nr:response regulator [Bacteroidota bacterium]